ncbi:MAG: sensor histidine kinase [Promethearchaeota archaeon]
MLKLKVKNQENILKILILIALISFSLFLTYYFELVLKTSIIFSHFFYLPIILACIWWKYKGMIIPIFLGCFLLFFPFSISTEILFIENLFRACIFIIVGIIIATLSNQISRTKELSNAYENIKFYKDLFTHDMNNILQSILSCAELYSLEKKNVKREENLDELIDIIKKQCYKASSLILNIIKLSELEDLKISLKPIDIIEILKKALTVISDNFKEKRININFVAPEDIYKIYGNGLLFDVFENILINAVKYNNSLTVEITIKVTKLRIKSKNYIKIEFIDNGFGIENWKKELIFQRGNREAKSSKGMGIGLTLVKKIVESYDGRIWVEDNSIGDYSQGSNFIVLFNEAN